MKHLDLFSGIGGASLALDRVFPNVEHEFCDIEPFSQAVLKKHWPNATIHGDIRELHPGPADIVTGGFPCQPFSSAGKRRGTEDDRHLWPEMLRVIREAAPAWVVGENVGGLLTWNGGMVLDSVFSDLEAEGYEVWAFVIPACAVNAPHRRDRVWIVAHTFGAGTRREGRETTYEGRKPREDRREGIRQGDWAVGSSRTLATTRDAPYPSGEQAHAAEQGGLHAEPRLSNRASGEAAPDAADKRRSGRRFADTSAESIGWGESDKIQPSRNSDGNNWDEDWLTSAARLCSMDDGLPGGLVRPRGWRNAALKGAGNAWVPQVAEEIFKAIKETGTLTS